MEWNRCPDLKWYIYVPNQIGAPMFLCTCASEMKSNRCPDLNLYTLRRRDIVLRAWNYPGVENFSRTDKLFRNAYSFSIPLVATVSSSTCSKLVTLLQSDMKGELPFQVCAFVCV